MQEAIATLPVLEHDQVVESRPNTTDTLLPGATDAMAAAAMQSNVQAMAAAAGVNMASMETLPAEVRGTYRQIDPRVSATALWPVPVEFLRTVTGGQLRMLIDDLPLRAQPQLGHAAATPISASLTLLAFRAGTTGKQP